MSPLTCSIAFTPTFHFPFSFTRSLSHHLLSHTQSCIVNSCHFFSSFFPLSVYSTFLMQSYFLSSPLIHLVSFFLSLSLYIRLSFFCPFSSACISLSLCLPLLSFSLFNPSSICLFLSVSRFVCTFSSVYLCRLFLSLSAPLNTDPNFRTFTSLENNEMP